MKKIIHVDMDYFYAQVEERDRPELKTRPVGVGGSPDGRGVLCTCNYIARKFGVRGAMPTFKALKLCPELVLIKPNFKKYKEASENIFKIFSHFTPIVQGLSLDEAYLDVTDCQEFNNSAVKIAQEIKKKIFQETGLTASAGVSFNKMLAKIASEMNKPDGLCVLTPEDIENKIKDFSVDKINGVGKVTSLKMEKMGIKTFKDLRSFSKLDLINHFGKFGPSLFNYSRGHDDREVKVARQRKTLSVEHTFIKDINDFVQLKEVLGNLFVEISDRLLKHQDKKIKSIFIKLKYNDFSVTTNERQKDGLDFQAFLNLAQERFEVKELPVRLLGIGVRFQTNSSNTQLSLI